MADNPNGPDLSNPAIQAWWNQMHGKQAPTPAQQAKAKPPVTDRSVSDMLARGANSVIPGRAAIGQELNQKLGNPMQGVNQDSIGGQFAQSVVDFINTLFAAKVGQGQSEQEDR